MKLYLSSFRFGPSEVLRTQRPNARAAIVMNAQDFTPGAKQGSIAAQFAGLEELGFGCEELDLRDYFARPIEMQEKLETLQLVWLTGGNAFVLARAMQQSGFVKAARALVRASKLLYAGYSAGACVAGPDLRGIDLMDRPEAMPPGYDPACVPACLDLVPFRVVPHWRSDHSESGDAERAVEYLEKEGLPFRTLSDGQALYVEGNETRLLS